MSNKILAGILILLIVIVGVLVYIKYQTEDIVGEAEAVTAVSFICDSGQHFVAEFDATFTHLSVIESGNLVRTLSSISDTYVQFADNNFSYSFGGEEVWITNLATGETTACNQPFDPNNAPYNFGDRGEGAGSEQPDAALIVSESILGVWRSVDDEKSVREFRGNGLSVDHYDGDLISEDSWIAFTSMSGIETPFPQQPNTVYLRFTSGGGDEILHFQVATLTPETLELTYLDRGGVLRYDYVGPVQE